MSVLDRPLRSAILAASQSETLRAWMTRYGMRMGAARFVAGESPAEFLAAAARANADGFAVAAGILGEGTRTAEDASAAAATYCELLDEFAARHLDANVALKPTHLGLELDPALAETNIASVLECAARHGNFVRLDMEQSAVTGATLELYQSLRARFDNVGCVLQAYLYRSEADLRALLPLRPNVRVVKGAYLEPPSIAYAKKTGVDENYVRLVTSLLDAGAYTAVATHDRAIVERVAAYAQARGLPKRGAFEFQMLYGVASGYAKALVDRGYRVRLAIPFGSFWFPYLMRRLAERPANLSFFVKGLLRL